MKKNKMPLDANGVPMQKIRPQNSSGYSFSVTSASKRNTSPIAEQVIGIYSESGAYIKFGDDSVTASPADYHVYIPAQTYREYSMMGQYFIAAISGGTDGALSICGMPARANKATFVSSGQVWVPTSLSSLKAWYDPNDASTISEDDEAGKVSALADKSGNGNTLLGILSTPNNQPENDNYTVFGRNALQFGVNAAAALTPSGAFADSTNFINAQNCHIACAFTRLGTTNVQRQGAMFHLKSTVGADLISDHFAGTSKAYFPDDTGTSYLIDSTNDRFAFGEDHVIGFDCSASDMQAFANGELIAQNNAPAASDFFDRFVVGYRTASSRAYVGLIGEIVVCDSALSQADRQDLEGYLARA